MIIVMFICVFIIAVIGFIVTSQKGPIIDPESHLKFLATTYLLNKDFLEDEKVINNMSKLGISKEDIVNYATIYEKELLKEQEEKDDNSNE